MNTCKGCGKELNGLMDNVNHNCPTPSKIPVQEGDVRYADIAINLTVIDKALKEGTNIITAERKEILGNGIIEQIDGVRLKK